MHISCVHASSSSLSLLDDTSAPKSIESSTSARVTISAWRPIEISTRRTAPTDHLASFLLTCNYSHLKGNLRAT